MATTYIVNQKGFPVPKITGRTSYVLKANGNWSYSLPKKQGLSNPPVIMVEDHGAVTPMLELLRLNKKIKDKNTMIHFDYHHDIYTNEPADSKVMLYRKPLNEREARNTYANCGNFILSLISTGTVKDLVWVLPAFRLWMGQHEVPQQNLSLLPLNAVDTKRPHQLADKAKVCDAFTLHKKYPGKKMLRSFKFITTMFSECRSNFPDPHSPVIIDIDMDWFGVKVSNHQAFRFFPQDILAQLTGVISYFRNVQAICIAKESRDFAYHTDKEPLLVNELLKKGIVSLSR